jgi:hypothetical protein
LDGPGAQTLTGATAFHHLTINNSSGLSAGVILDSGQTVNGALTLIHGLVRVGSHNLTLGPNATTSGGSASSMLVTDSDGSATGDGFVCKQYAAGTADPSVAAFPVGDATNTAQYSPATLDFGSSTFASGAQVCVRVTNSRHPSWPGSTNPTYINRFWTVSQQNIPFFTCTTSFAYRDDSTGEDVVIGAGQSEAALFHKIWTGTAWTTGNQADATANTFGSTVTGFSDHTAFSGSPLGVTLVDFSAVQQADAVLVTWETNSELENRGFNLYRGTSAAGPDRQLNATLIPSQSQGNPGGFIYTWDDHADLVPGTTYFYWVEDVSLSGATTLHAPVRVDFAVPTAVTLGTVQAKPAARLALPLTGTLLALLAPLAGTVAVRRRRVQAHGQWRALAIETPGISMACLSLKGRMVQQGKEALEFSMRMWYTLRDSARGRAGGRQ